uniref:Uncharacterized protein n=1 Tax=Aegilops tauschii subsp. strangulata TaxID=200361 RepID=A0A453FPX5_AEGTS
MPSALSSGSSSMGGSRSSHPLRYPVLSHGGSLVAGHLHRYVSRRVDGSSYSFASQSQARAHAIRTALGEVKLHDLTVTDYFNKVTGMADTLASIGKALDPEEFTSYVLNGLSDN